MNITKEYPGDLELLCINTIRCLAIDMVEQAKSGHPGMPMGCAPMAYALWTRFLRHNPGNPQWPGRDRFILSAGHGSALLYSMLHLSGYAMPLSELQGFRQWGSKAAGHPEFRVAPGVETTTGPLGQGLANGVGMAIAERYQAAYFNRPGYDIVDNHTYIFASDGDLMEGISHEAASVAGHLGLGRLICLWDNNGISIEGGTRLTFTEDVLQRFAAYGWHVQCVDDGNSIAELTQAIAAAKAEADRPSLIAVRTVIGFGSPHKAGTAGVHGEPLGPQEAKLTKENLGWTYDEPFFVPEPVYDFFRQAVARGKQAEDAWIALFEKYQADFPALAGEFQDWRGGVLPADWEQAIPKFEPARGELATRLASGEILNKIAARIPNLLGGSADLAPSTKTLLSGEGDFSKENYRGRNLHFGVREHAMGAISNGLALYGGLMPFCGTFLIFSDYMKPAIRLAALMRLKVLYVFTHDSIGLGEDGPTHQPVEQLAALRAIPGLTVIRPADANETAQAWQYAVQQAQGPVALVLTRQSVPVLAADPDVSQGAYVVQGEIAADHQILLLATGSEVHLALEAGKKLAESEYPVAVISMPSWELFDRQPFAYRQTVLPAELKARVAIEAASSFGWHKYVGAGGEIISVDHFGASAPYKELYRQFGLTPDDIVRKAIECFAAQGRK